MSKTVTGHVVSTKRVNSSYFAYAIQNLEFTLFDYVFTLSRAGRIVSAKRV